MPSNREPATPAATDPPPRAALQSTSSPPNPAPRNTQHEKRITHYAIRNMYHPIRPPQYAILST
ncbi:MAG TPA: hypothetical protein VIK64_15710, partial [Anaerolineales bacterium]